jgi:hypothetical protein
VTLASASTPTEPSARTEQPVDVTASVHELEVADRRRQLKYHRMALILACVVLALAAVLKIRNDKQVLVPLIDLPLPEICVSQRFFNVDCPGCGLTRCFISLAHGEVRKAWQYNPAGLAWFAVVVAQLPYRAAVIWRLRRGGTAPEMAARYVNAGVWALMIALVVQWLARIVERLAS